MTVEILSSVVGVLKSVRCCDAVGREMGLAILSSLMCPEMDWNTRIAGKAMLCLYFN